MPYKNPHGEGRARRIGASHLGGKAKDSDLPHPGDGKSFDAKLLNPDWTEEMQLRYQHPDRRYEDDPVLVEHKEKRSWKTNGL